MNNRTTLTTIALALSCIRILVYFIEYIGIKLLDNSFTSKLLNGIGYTNSVMNIAVILFIAYALNLIKENIWRSIGFISSAFMITVFLMLSLAKVNDPGVFKTVGILNILMLVFFIIQSFLVENAYFKNAFIIYPITIILMVIINAAIPYIAYQSALPVSSVQYLSLLNIVPAIAECYIIYLFQQYFKTHTPYQENDFSSNL